MKRKLPWPALLVCLGVAMTPLVATANTYYENSTSIATAPDPTIIPTAIAPTPATEPGGLDVIFCDVVRETAYKDPPSSAPASCTAKSCRVGAVTQGGLRMRQVAADLKPTVANCRHCRGHRLQR